jgi:hypothetical protein
MLVEFATVPVQFMRADVLKFLREIAIATAMNSMPSAYAEEPARPMRIRTVCATALMRVSEQSMPAVFATARGQSMLADALKSPLETVIAMETNSMPSACAEEPARPMQTKTVCATALMRASEQSMPAVFATARVPFMRVDAPASRQAIAIATATSSTPWACAAGLALRTWTTTAFVTTKMRVWVS